MLHTFSTPGPVWLDVSLPVGDVVVEAGPDDATTTVELVARNEEARRLAEDATVELRERGDGFEVMVHVKQSRLRFAIVIGRSHALTVRIACPPGSRLRARTASADVTSRTALAAAHVESASGDVGLEDVAGDLTLKTASGDVRAGAVGGSAAVNVVSGDCRLASVGGAVAISSVSGDVTVGEVVRDDVAIRSVSGDVVVGVRRGTRIHVDARSVSGDTRSDLGLSAEPVAGDGPQAEVRINTVSGDIRITRASAGVR